MTELHSPSLDLAGVHRQRVEAVMACGFTERQARFLVLVMRHAGVCVPRWLRHGNSVFEGPSSPAIAEALASGRGRVEIGSPAACLSASLSLGGGNADASSLDEAGVEEREQGGGTGLRASSTPPLNPCRGASPQRARATGT